MDTMLVAFWLFSSVIIAANIVVRLWRPEPSARRSYALFPPILSFSNSVADREETENIDYFDNTLTTQAAGGD